MREKIEWQCNICSSIGRTEEGYYIRCQNNKCKNNDNVYRFIKILK